MQIRRFGPAESHVPPIPQLHNVSLVILQVPEDGFIPPEDLANPSNPPPFVLDRPNFSVVQYYAPHAEMEEHPADDPILMLAIDGSGFLRLGGPDGETAEIRKHAAVLWPAGVPHRVWTEDQPLTIVLFHYGPDR